MGEPTLLRRVEYAFWLTGALLVSFCAGAYLEMRVYQAAENRRLEDALRLRGPRELPAGRLRSPQPAAGSLVGRLEIPRLKVSAVVLEGSDGGTLRVGLGRVKGTAEPGEEGNVVVGGHRDTFFRPLRGIRAGDRVTLVTPRGRYGYVVEWTAVVDPGDRRSLGATAERSLTLVTCFPFRYVGPAPQRFVVRARQVAPDGARLTGT